MNRRILSRMLDPVCIDMSLAVSVSDYEGFVESYGQ